jgi:hypothetical protein
LNLEGGDPIMGAGDPGGEGDPHITTFSGVTFAFKGAAGRLYNFLTRGPLRVLPRLLPVPGDPPGEERTYIAGVDVEGDGPFKVVVMGGTTHVLAHGHHVEVESKHCTLDAPGHLGETAAAPHPLSGVAHLNVYVPTRPDPEDGATGLLVDGDRQDAAEADYEVDG